MKTTERVVTDFIHDLKASLREEIRVEALRQVDVVSKGRPAGKTEASPPAAAKVKVKRRKGPIQLCPVPGCKNRAAPIFGMVCAVHRNLPKAVVKKHREARRAKMKSVGSELRLAAKKK